MRPVASTTYVRSTTVSGTFSLVNNTNEQDVIAVTIAKRIFIYSALLDCVNITQDGTVRFYSKIDGVNYRRIHEVPRTDAADPDGVLLPVILGTNTDFKITYQAAIVEGAARNIPYRIVYALAER